MIKHLLSGLVLLLAMAAPVAARAVDTGHIEAELGAATQGIVPGRTVQVALRQKLQPGWHTYWRNAGDAGEPTRIVWTLPAGWTAGEIVWAPPHRIPVGPLVNYGYEGEVLLPVPLTAPKSAKVGDSVVVKAAVDFLVCKEICIPEHADLQLTLPVTAADADADPAWGPAIAAALAAAPKPAGLTATFTPRGGQLILAVAGAKLADARISQAYFFPYVGGLVDPAKAQTVERGPRGLTLSLPALPGSAPVGLAGVLALGEQVYEIAATPGAAPAGVAGLGTLPPAPLPASAVSASRPTALSPAAGGAPLVGMGLPLAVAFAFLGGLILNLMPCVFPILAMKAAALAGHGHERRSAQAQGLAFAAGVIATFLILAAVLIGLRAAGAAVGWGFQLQSPPVVAGLALLMLAVALNLSGVFAVGTSLQNTGSTLASRRGLAGAFFTGALAVVVAAPCTAPFMAPALGWALTLQPAWALVIFLALGVGFAAPFTAIALIPGSLSWLPRPGPWMDGLKTALAFPMYAAAAWLVWVLTVQAGTDALIRILGAALVAALAAWLAGVAQRGAGLAASIAAAILAALALAVALVPAYAPFAPATAAAKGGRLNEEPYSAERLAALRAQGRPVFVNYTAAWCVSCQVNDRLALSTAATARAFAAHKVAYLKADWTLKDPAIAADLARFGRAGVPLYLVYGAGGGEPVILPPILTEGAVIKAVEAAARS